MRRCSLLLLAVLLAAPAARADEPPHALRITPDTLVANEEGEWHAELQLVNHSQWGLYPDSLEMLWVNAAPERGSEARGVRDLAPFVRVMQPAASGDATGVIWSAPAEFERGSLVFRIVAHDAQQHTFEYRTPVVVAGSQLAEQAPPRLVEAAGARTDYFLLADSAAGAAPALVYLPPAGVPARSLLRWAHLAGARGYAVAVVSLPGAGRSSGNADAAGPASVALVRAALDRIARDPHVDPSRIVLWGSEDGATTALLAAVDRKDLAGVIAQEARHDPWAHYRALRDDAARQAFTAAAGRDSAAWKARATLPVAERIPAPVLLLESAEAHAPSTAPAEAFAARRSAAGLFIESRLAGSEPKPFRRADAARVAYDFLRRRTH